MTIQDSNPLVSIIVRTKDRPEILRIALRSIASQTYRPIEVVLVNDGGCTLEVPAIREVLRDIPLNYLMLEKNTGRAHAGNVGIENTKGKYVGFLDDDDEFYSHHIETLALFMEQNSYMVAYSGTEMVFEESVPGEKIISSLRKEILSKSFSYKDLLIANYIPLNSILFSREVLIAAKGFDETFELYEDWDLLIRAAANNLFYHLKELTVRYYQWNKDFQINQKDPLYVEEARLKLMQKHCNRKAPETVLPKEKEADRQASGIEKIPGWLRSYYEQNASEYETYTVALNDLEDSEETKRERVGNFAYRPKISILTPVYNVDEKWLRLAIESVINQIYDNWELCLCDGGSNRPYVRTVIEGYAAKDGRIKAKYLSENKGISGNSNEALALADGEFVCLLDHDDELPPSALYEVVKLLNEDQDIDFIYTDEDKISAEGKRFEPHFKPDWSPDSFRSYNYITHLAAIRKKVIDGVGGFRSEFDGSQDYDLFLRVVERTQKIAHIPKILYHWRSHALSVAGDSTVKMYAYDSAKRALKKHIQRLGLDGEIYDGHFLGLYRIKYHLKAAPPVTIIIPTKDKACILRKCIESILTKSTYDNYNILVVDNLSSEEETFRYYADIGGNARIRLIKYDKPFNYSAINNYAVRHTDSEYIVFLNNDTEVISCDWLEAMLEFDQRDEVGVVGALLLYPDNTVQHAGTIIGLFGVAGQPFRKLSRESVGYFGRGKLIQNLSAVSGACMMIKRKIFEEAAGFDEKYSHTYGDADLCMKLRKLGYLIVYTPYAQLYHHESLTMDALKTVEKHKHMAEGRRLFHINWKSTIEKGDSYYNPNLTLLFGDFSIKKLSEFVSDKADADAFSYGLLEAYEARLEAVTKGKGMHINELEEALKHKGIHVNELEEAVKHKGIHVNELEEAVKHKGIHVNELEEAVKQQGIHVNELEEALKHKGIHVNELEEAVKQQGVHINELEELLKHKKNHADEIESVLQEKEAYIQLIHSGHGWRLLTRYFKLRDRLLPAGTKRRLFVKAFIRIIISPKRVLGNLTKANFKKFLYNLKRSDEDTFYSKANVSEGAEQNIPAKAANRDYFNFLFEMNTKRGEDYVSLSNPGIPETDIRLIAFYLPQFHPIPENDEWWGPGFTEWTNVTRAVPQFIGHYQPRLPGELGFYDLRIPDVQKRQVALAKQYGIYGFCFHFYWFNSRTLLEMPLKNFTENTDFPFCINWANENWTRRWDGQDSEVLIGQKHSPEDDMEFIKYVSKYFRNKNYIKIKSKPLLMVYRPALFPDPKATAERWRKWCLENGIGEIYLAATHSFEHVDPATIGFDAAVEFAPNTFVLKDISDKLQVINQEYKGIALDYKEAVRFSKNYIKTPFKKFRGICPGWDNEARKPGKGTLFVNSTPEKFKQWLKYLCHYTHSNFDPDERMIFINAWNEWAEGAYLEPDRRQGYANIRAVADALTEYSREIKSLNENTKRPDTAVILHLFYTDLWHEISSYLLNLGCDTDLYISLPEHADRGVCTEILKAFPAAKIFFLENRGRDIVPFLHIFSLIAKADYKYICKIHTKKSIHRSDGDIWRRDLYEKLCGSPAQVSLIKEAFDQHEGIGIIGPEGHQVSHSYYWGSNKNRTEELAKELGLNDNLEFSFFAGSMFWFRPSALKPLLNLNLCVDDFEPEMNQVDGTLAHAIERLFPLAARAAGYITVHTGFLNNPACIQDMLGNNGKTEKAESPYRFCESAADKRPEV